MESARPITLECFYAYGYRGRSMMAVRAPFATGAEACELIGRIVQIEGVAYRALAVFRQVSGPIAVGEPIGLEVRALAPDRPAA